MDSRTESKKIVKKNIFKNRNRKDIVETRDCSRPERARRIEKK